MKLLDQLADIATKLIQVRFAYPRGEPTNRRTSEYSSVAVGWVAMPDLRRTDPARLN